jgi:uncharacterized protein (TIGR03067 family)
MRRVKLLLPLLSLGFAPLPFLKGKPLPEDLKKMQGAWAVARRSVGGVSAADARDTTVVIAGDRICFLVKGVAQSEWSVTVDRSGAPKVLDRTFVPRKLAAKGRIRAAEVHRGIYHLDGDTLRLSHALEPGDLPRPPDFAGGPNHNAYVLKRLKP